MFFTVRRLLHHDLNLNNLISYVITSSCWGIPHYFHSSNYVLWTIFPWNKNVKIWNMNSCASLFSSLKIEPWEWDILPLNFKVSDFLFWQRQKKRFEMKSCKKVANPHCWLSAWSRLRLIRSVSLCGLHSCGRSLVFPLPSWSWWEHCTRLRYHDWLLGQRKPANVEVGIPDSYKVNNHWRSEVFELFVYTSRASSSFREIRVIKICNVFLHCIWGTNFLQCMQWGIIRRICGKRYRKIDSSEIIHTKFLVLKLKNLIIPRHWRCWILLSLVTRLRSLIFCLRGILSNCRKKRRFSKPDIIVQLPYLHVSPAEREIENLHKKWKR